MRKVKIKTWGEIEAISHSSNEVCFFAPVGYRHVFPYALEPALPKDRIIKIQSDNSWHIGNILFKIGEWVIDEVIGPNAIDDQAKAWGEGLMAKQRGN